LRQVPLFVPFEDDWLAVVVTIPDGRPRALVAMLQGAGGAPRSHRYRLWSRLSSTLAERGLASVRMDYRGVGDSTGAPSGEDHVAPLDQALAAVQAARALTGLDRLGVVATCRGNGTALQVATALDPEASVACVLPKGLNPIVRRAGSPSARRRLRRLAGSIPVVGRLAAARRARSAESGVRFIGEVEQILSTGHLLLLHGGTEASRRRLTRGVGELTRRMGGGAEHRAEVQVLFSEGRAGFRPLETQQLLIDTVIEFLDRTLPPSPRVVHLPDVEEVRSG
jgi:hypothetical protein